MFDEDGLLKSEPHPIGKDACHNVRWPPGREWHDDGYRPLRIFRNGAISEA